MTSSKRGRGLNRESGGGESNEIVIGIVILGVDQSDANLCLSLIPWEKLPARPTREEKEMFSRKENNRISFQGKTAVFHFKGKRLRDPKTNIFFCLSNYSGHGLVDICKTCFTSTDNRIVF